MHPWSSVLDAGTDFVLLFTKLATRIALGYGGCAREREPRMEPRNWIIAVLPVNEDLMQWRKETRQVCDCLVPLALLFKQDQRLNVAVSFGSEATRIIMATDD